MRYVEGIGSFFSKENDLGKTIYNSIVSNIDKNDFNIRKSGEYKISMNFRGENIEIYRSPSNTYLISIGNKSYDISSRICKKIWNVLNNRFNNDEFKVGQLKKKFEEVGTGDEYIDGLGKGRDDAKLNSNKEIMSEFNSKKGSIDVIFSKGYKDGELDSEILKKIFGGSSKSQNPICKGYISMKRIERSIKKIENSLLDFKDDIKEINDKMSDLRSKAISNPDMLDYYNNQISNQKLSLDTVNKSISNKQKSIQDLKKRVSEERNNFKSTMSKFI